MVGSWDPVEMTITCDQHNVSIPHSLLCGGDVIVMNNITMYYKNNSIVFSKYNIMPHQYCNIIVVVVLSWFFFIFQFFFYSAIANNTIRADLKVLWTTVNNYTIDEPATKVQGVLNKC